MVNRLIIIFEYCVRVPRNSNMYCQQVQEEFICRVISLIDRKSARISDASATDDEIKTLTDTFRWLRNNSPGLDESTKRNVLQLGLVETCSWFCDYCFINEPLSCSVLLQFLSNFSVDHKIAQQNIIEGFCSVLR